MLESENVQNNWDTEARLKGLYKECEHLSKYDDD